MRFKAIATMVAFGSPVHGPVDMSITLKTSESPDLPEDFFAKLLGGQVTVMLSDEADPIGFRSRLAQAAHDDAQITLGAAQRSGGIGFQAMQDREATRRAVRYCRTCDGWHPEGVCG